MNLDEPQSLSPDEMFAAAGLALGEAILGSLGEWGERITGDRVGAAHAAVGREAGERIAHSIARPLADLLAADIDAQRGTPLTLLRAHHGPLTELLASLGAATVTRDEADTAAAPDDIYGIAPRAYRDLSEDVHDAGLRWGVTKAFAHRARHQTGG